MSYNTRLFVARITWLVGKDMPIYEYRCESCGEELEKIQKFSDPPLTDCPACGKPALKKLVSASSFRLKGSGWYETDFKNGSNKTAAGNKTGDNKKSSSGDSGKKATDSPSSSSATSSKKGVAAPAD